MLRSSGSRRRSRLSRSQSSSSFQSGVAILEHIDPVTAQKDAHLAANLSFNTAYRRPISEMEHLSWDRHGLPHDDGSSVHRAGEYNLRRQHSIRFVNSTPGPGQSVRERSDIRDRSTTEHSTTGLLDVSNGAGAGTRPQSRASSIVRPPTVSSYTRDYVSSMRADRHNGDVDKVASSTSTSRQLGNSRSMFVPPSCNGPASRYYFTSEPPNRQAPSRPLSTRASVIQNKENGPPSTESPILWPPKPMTFLKIRRSQAATPTVTSRQETNDLAIQLARDKFRHQVEKQEQLKSRPSMLFRATRKKSEGSRGFRKSLRTVSNTSTNFSLALSSSNNLALPKDGGLRKKARKVSNGLKSKLKGLFHRDKSEENAETAQQPSPTLPQQDKAHEREDEYMNIPEPGQEECSIIQGASRLPSLHAVPSSQQLRSRQGSIECMRSDNRKASDERSRVTSWTSSGIASVQSEKSCERLPVIKERTMPPGTAYSNSVYSDDKPHSVHSNADSTNLIDVPIYSPATIFGRPGSLGPQSPGTDRLSPSQSMDRIISGASSVEWKTHLASQVSRREVSASTIKGDNHDISRYSGHVRENAVIEEEEPIPFIAESLHSPRTATTFSEPRTRLNQQQESPRASASRPAPPRLQKPPPIPERSSLRPMASTHNITSFSGNTSPSNTGTLSVRSQKTMPDLADRATEKENAAPKIGVSRSVSPVKLVRRNRAQPGISTAGTTSLRTAYQTTLLGSPVARNANASAYSRLGALLEGDDKLHGTRDSDGEGVENGTLKATGSRQMVDQFLSSRRRGIARSEDGQGSFV